jgi:ABC-2 type transport system permease protein
MFKFWISIKKELRILFHDKTGLLLMFVMPILLVYIITIIQDSAFKVVNENKISIVLVNQDKGEQGLKLIELMQSSKVFTVIENHSLNEETISEEMSNKKHLTGLIIPEDFSQVLLQKSNLVSNIIQQEIGTAEVENDSMRSSSILFYHDPVLQDNYCSSIMNIVNAFIKSIEGEILITQISEQLELKDAPEKLKEVMLINQLPVERISTANSEHNVLPNATQHNVPAWTIFAMFFIVVSLGNNIVKERVNGSFLRLKSMPTSFMIVLSAKFLVYLAAVFAQVLVIFSLAKFTFPAIGLPELSLPSNPVAFLVVVLMSSTAAISYSMTVGTLAKTQEQANGFGAVSVVIMAALGGIWVPIFVMPEYMKIISYASPLHWCLEGFYDLFLRGGSWSNLVPSLLALGGFSLICFAITYIKLKADRIL